MIVNKRFVLGIILVWLFLLGICVIAQAGTKTIQFAWNQEISEGFAGWKLYRSTSPNVQVTPANLFATIPYGGATATEYTTSQPLISPDGQSVTYYFVMTAFDNAGNESDKSNEVSQLIDFMAPGVPIQLKVNVVAQ